MFLFFDRDEDHALNKQELEGWAKELMKPQVRRKELCCFYLPEATFGT
jgi:hypothetical protein